jgi:ferric-dicitrate binding protein FerR (iron transport regulator)
MVATWTIAASLLILIGTSVFQALYTKSISTGSGEERMITFTDGSTLKLNAQSVTSYHPYWWKFSRKVTLSGEGCFEVTPGRTFSVQSDNGVTTVLGTRFTVYSRQTRYEVSCLSGKVKVESTLTDDAVILQPNEKASLNDHGKLDLNQLQETEKQVSPIQTEWIFTNEPLHNVIQTIESQYHIKIGLPAGDRHRFTGGFDMTMPLQSVLDLVCTPFGYTFTQKANGEFEIYPK